MIAGGLVAETRRACTADHPGRRRSDQPRHRRELDEATALTGLAEPQLPAMTYLSARMFPAGWACALLHFTGLGCGATFLRTDGKHA